MNGHHAKYKENINQIKDYQNPKKLQPKVTQF